MCVKHQTVFGTMRKTKLLLFFIAHSVSRVAGTPRHKLRFDNKNNQFYKSFHTKAMESILTVKNVQKCSKINSSRVGLLKMTKDNSNILKHSRCRISL